MHRLDEDMAKMRARLQALSEKSGESRRDASEVEEEIRILQAGASQSNGCSSKSSQGSTEIQVYQSRRQEKKRRKLGKKMGMMREWPMVGMRVLHVALLWTLLQAQMPLAEALGWKSQHTKKWVTRS